MTDTNIQHMLHVLINIYKYNANVADLTLSNAESIRNNCLRKINWMNVPVDTKLQVGQNSDCITSLDNVPLDRVRYFAVYVPNNPNKVGCFDNELKQKNASTIHFWRHISIHPDVDIKPEWYDYPEPLLGNQILDNRNIAVKLLQDMQLHNCGYYCKN